jgi:hypothetical protein
VRWNFLRESARAHLRRADLFSCHLLNHKQPCIIGVNTSSSIQELWGWMSRLFGIPVTATTPIGASAAAVEPHVQFY